MTDLYSAQHTEKQRPAAHYNNKIHVDKTLSSLMFSLKRTAKKVSLQLSFESSGGNSLSECGWEIVPNSWTGDRESTVTQSCTCALYSGCSTVVDLKDRQFSNSPELQAPFPLKFRNSLQCEKTRLTAMSDG